MFKTAASFIGLRRPVQDHDPAITVDYSLYPTIPNGASRIISHRPAGTGAFQLLPEKLELVEFSPGTTYAEYRATHGHEPLGDAVILDAIARKIQAAVHNPAEFKRLLVSIFGSFSGQIFFLGTVFESTDGRECVPYLNIKTMYLAFRYICPAHHVINHDVTCCACFLR